jgi:hypothetical protein
MGIQHLEPEDLKGERNQLGQFRDACILLVEDREYFLDKVLGTIPRYP